MPRRPLLKPVPPSDPAVPNRRREDALALLLLLGLVIAFFWEPIFTRLVLLPTDICLRLQPWRAYSKELFPDFTRLRNPLLDVILSFVPWRMYMAREMTSGIVPLWNPYILCGTPFVANNQSAVFYPFNWLFLFLPVGEAFTLYEILHVYLCGAFLYLFLRRLRLSWAACLIGASAWMFSGFVVTWLEWQVLAATLCWLPLILLFWEKAQEKGFSFASAGGMCFGMQLLAGHLQSAFYSAFAVGIYALGQVIGKRTSPRKGFPALLWIWALGMCLGAIQTLPVFELARYNHRQGALTYEAVAANAMPLPQMLTLLIPKLLGTSADYASTPYSGKLAYPEMCFYFGVIPLALALAAVALRRDAVTRSLAAVALLAVLVGTATPVLKLFYLVVPGFKQMPSPARMMVLLTFSGSILAALGWDALIEAARNRAPAAPLRLRILAGVWLAVPLLALVASLLAYPQYLFGNDSVGTAWAGYQAQNFAVFLVMALCAAALFFRAAQGRFPASGAHAAALGLILLDLFRFGMGFNPSGDPKMLFFPARSLEDLRRDSEPGRTLALMGSGPLDQMTPNANMVPQIEDVQGGESLYPRRVKEFMQFLEDQGRPGAGTRFWNAVHITNIASPLLPMLNVRHILTSRLLDAPQAEMVARPDIYLYRLKNAFPRAWIAPEAIWIPERLQILSHLNRPGFDPRKTVVLQGEGPSRTGGPGTARVLRRTPNRAVLQADAPRGGWLVLADTCAPGWQADLDGQPVPIHPANYMLRAVWLPPGSHRVTFAYAPTSFRLGAYLSLLALAGLASAAGLRLSLKKSRPVEDTPGFSVK
ncbi:MAG: YfhO family protein [Armatimonadetes bacterium]|nr:YfhO family protein [Armatimonadota bacterium]